MRRFWLLRGLRGFAFMVLAVAVFSGPVMWLWNWVLPAVSGWHRIDYTQAVALLVLCRILFGGWWRHRGGGQWREHSMREHLAQLSPEERERFRQTLRRRCGRDTTAPGENAGANS